LEFSHGAPLSRSVRIRSPRYACALPVELYFIRPVPEATNR
jgi:hypothetical protein